MQLCGGGRPDWKSRGLVPGNQQFRIGAEVCQIKARHLPMVNQVFIQRLRRVMDTRDVRIIDVRPKTEFGICHLPSSIRSCSILSLVNFNPLISNSEVPLNEIVANPTKYISASDEPPVETYVVCRLGNDSQIAAEALRNVNSAVIVKDLIGGLQAWSQEVDHKFPIY